MAFRTLDPPKHYCVWIGTQYLGCWMARTPDHALARIAINRGYHDVWQMLHDYGADSTVREKLPTDTEEGLYWELKQHRY